MNRLFMENQLNFAKQYMDENDIITADKYEILYQVTKEINRTRGNELLIEYLCDGKNDDLLIHYVDSLLNKLENEDINLGAIEQFWAEQVREYFRNQPFKLSADISRTIGASLDELFEQARARQKQNPGTQYLGTMLQT